MMIRQIKETSLYVTDLERSFRFYHQLLGLPLISREEDRHVFLRAGQSVLLLFNAAKTREETILPSHEGYGRLHLAFEANPEEYQNWKDFLRQAAVPIIHEHQWSGDQQSFYFHDPDGHVLEIVPQGMWGD